MSVIKEWLQSVGIVQTPISDDPNELLEQFYSTLGVIHLAARDIGSESSETDVDQKIKELLVPEQRTWPGAYRIEQLLSLVMTEDQLDAELKRRLDEAKKLELTYISTLDEQLNESNIQKNAPCFTACSMIFNGSTCREFDVAWLVRGFLFG